MKRKEHRGVDFTYPRTVQQEKEQSKMDNATLFRNKIINKVPISLGAIANNWGNLKISQAMLMRTMRTEAHYLTFIIDWMSFTCF